MTNQKKTTRKLTLSRETLRTIREDTLAKVAGGISADPPCDCSLGMCTRTTILQEPV